MTWTEELIRQLRNLAAAGKTSGQIATALGLTRGAVIGKMSREGIPLARLPFWGSRAAPKKNQSPLRGPPAKPRVPPLQGRMGAGPAIMAVMPYHCEWPFGDPASEDFHFCSEPRDPYVEPPYCPKHAEIAVVRRR